VPLPLFRRPGWENNKHVMFQSDGLQPVRHSFACWLVETIDETAVRKKSNGNSSGAQSYYRYYRTTTGEVHLIKRSTTPKFFPHRDPVDVFGKQQQ
jgi:hypothetical protein